MENIEEESKDSKTITASEIEQNPFEKDDIDEFKELGNPDVESQLIKKVKQLDKHIDQINLSLCCFSAR